jgi:hypothetical protein
MCDFFRPQIFFAGDMSGFFNRFFLLNAKLKPDYQRTALQLLKITSPEKPAQSPQLSK